MIKEYILENIKTKEKILNDENLLVDIENAIKLITNSFLNGGVLFCAGNGGSAADAQHFAGEFVAKFAIERYGLPAIALTTDSSILTAVSNDLGYENIFARQIETLGKEGDVFVAISTSGTSPNIIKALESAKIKKMTTIVLTGEKSAIKETFCDCCIKVPSAKTPIIQECHIMIEHIICAMVEKKLFSK